MYLRRTPVSLTLLVQLVAAPLTKIQHLGFVPINNACIDCLAILIFAHGNNAIHHEKRYINEILIHTTNRRRQTPVDA